MTKPITPPPELVKQWLTEPEYVSGWNGKCMMLSMTDHRLSNICAKAAQYGADQELEACCKWVDWKWSGVKSRELRAARRTKQPSLKARALVVLDDCSDRLEGAHKNIIRRALEALDD